MKSALLLSLLAVSVSAAVAAPVNDPSWPMYQGMLNTMGLLTGT